jgi:hypothetical protein
MINEFTIYGERCSGTNYVEQLILSNFDVKVTWRHGWKHFFGFHNLGNADNTLFVCVVRDPIKWINSLYRTPHHICDICKKSQANFLNYEIYSKPDTWDSRKYYGPYYNFYGEDRHIYTKKRYKNIFELRHVKLQYLLDDLPTKVKHHIVIRYEDLLTDFEKTMEKIRDTGLKVKSSINFPVNYNKYMEGNKQSKKNPIFVTHFKKDEISKGTIVYHPSFNKKYEEQLGYL